MTAPAVFVFFERERDEKGDVSVTIEARDAYDELIRRSRELATLASCSAVLG